MRDLELYEAILDLTPPRTVVSVALDLKGQPPPPRLLPFTSGSGLRTSPEFPPTFPLTLPEELTRIPPWLSRATRNTG